jgi:hypothetical protein
MLLLGVVATAAAALPSTLQEQLSKLPAPLQQQLRARAAKLQALAP